MMKDNRDRAEHLYDAIGEIDDKLIADAESSALARAYIKARRKRRLSLACAACVCLLLLGAALRIPDVIRAPQDLSNDSSPDTHQNAAADKAPAPSTLAALLKEAEDSKKVSVLAANELPVISQTAMLVWQSEGEQDYRAIKIPDAKTKERITKALDTPKAAFSPEDSEALDLWVWIVYEDGRVVSPYLKHTQGNVSYGSLFDYSAEVEPNAALVKALHEVLN